MVKNSRFSSPERARSEAMQIYYVCNPPAYKIILSVWHKCQPRALHPRSHTRWSLETEMSIWSLEIQISAHGSVWDHGNRKQVVANEKESYSFPMVISWAKPIFQIQDMLMEQRVQKMTSPFISVRIGSSKLLESHFQVNYFYKFAKAKDWEISVRQYKLNGLRFSMCNQLIIMRKYICFYCFQPKARHSFASPLI